MAIKSIATSTSERQAIYRQTVYAAPLIAKMVERIATLAQLLYQNEVEREGGAITTIRTYIKSISLILDEIMENPQLSATDTEVIKASIELLNNSISLIQQKIEKEKIKLEGYIGARIDYLLRDLKWCRNKLEKLIKPKQTKKQ